jgi:nucleoside-diphosphate-sugar epimerase
VNLLITGALGHIGSRFIHSLKPGDFDKVVLIDNLSSQRYASLFNLPEGVHFSFVEDDICTADLEEYFSDIDVVLHLAAITDAAGSFEIQDQVELVNFQGTERVARACQATGSRLIFLSTTSVYGVQEGEVDEDCAIDQLQPQSPYAETKLKSEQLLQKMGQSEMLRYVICRFGTIFGTSTGMRFHTAVNKFCWQAVMGQPITVWRTALNQKRPYLDLDDAIEALKLIIDRDLFDGGLYNVVTTNSTVGNIVDAISEHIPDASIEYVDSPIMNQLSYHVNADRFSNLGFTFSGSLERGIGLTIDLFKGANARKP